MAVVKFDLWVKIIIELRNGTHNILKLSGLMDITYSHTFRVCKELEDLGFTKTRIEGRCREIELTESGSKVAKNLAEIMEEFNKDDNKKTKHKKMRMRKILR